MRQPLLDTSHKQFTTKCLYKMKMSLQIVITKRKMLLQIVTINQCKISCITYVFIYFPCSILCKLNKFLFLLLSWKLWHFLAFRLVKNVTTKLVHYLLSRYHYLKWRKCDTKSKCWSGWCTRNSSPMQSKLIGQDGWSTVHRSTKHLQSPLLCHLIIWNPKCPLILYRQVYIRGGSRIIHGGPNPVRPIGTAKPIFCNVLFPENLMRSRQIWSWWWRVGTSMYLFQCTCCCCKYHLYLCTCNSFL